VEVAVAVRRVEKVDDLFLVDRVPNETEALLVGQPHDALHARRRVVGHLFKIATIFYERNLQLYRKKLQA
jgi:hypothetical protein